MQLVQVGEGTRTVVATEVVEDVLQVPIPFRLELDDVEWSVGNRYSLAARIAVGDATMFVTPDDVFVLTEGHPIEDVELVLQVDRKLARDGAAELLVDVLSRVENAEESRHRWERQGAESDFIAFSQDDRVIYVEETLEVLGVGRSTIGYVFGDEENLLVARELRQLSSDDDSENEQRVQLLVIFDGSGNVVDAAKEIDGQPATVAPHEPQGMLQHVTELLEIHEQAG